MTIIGSASIQIRADDKYFEPDVRRAVAKIKNVSIVLKADVDLAKATKKIRDLRYRITSKDAVLKIDANLAKAEAKMAKFLAKFLEKDLNFNAVANTQGANTALSTLRDKYKNSRIPFTAQADTGAANSMLAFAARNRRSMISATVDPQTVAALTGLFNTLTGTLPIEKIKGALSGIAANFEGIATKGALVTTALGAISATLLTTAANVFSIAADIGQAVGAVALMPAALFGLTIVLKTNKLAWENFGTAAADNSKKANEALAKLPPEAQEAAKALRGVKDAIQKPVQGAFWEAVGTSLQDMVEEQLPSVIRGMTGIGSAMGGFSAEFFNTIKNLGDFNDVFLNIETSIRNMIPALNPAITALATFIGTGSTYLPRFGEWVSELANQFGEFTRKAQESGQINVWIETGIQRLQELGSIAKSTVGIFGGLADAARISGAPGLTEMAEGMRNLRDTVNGEPFQSRLVAVLEGARAGTDAFAEGLSDLTEYIGESSDAIGIFLDKTGQIAGLALTSVRSLFDGTGLGSGIYKALEGLRVAMDEMQPGFADLGGAIGDLGEIADVLFRSMAPGLNQLFETVEGIIAGLKDGIIAAMPVFNEFVQAILEVVQGPVILLAEQIGDVLEGFSKLPAAVQTVIMSIGLFLLLKNKFIGFFAGLGASLTNEQTNMGRGFNQIRAGADQMRGGVADSFAIMGASMKNALVETVESSSRAFSPLIGRAQDTSDRVKGAFATIGDGLKAGLNLSPQFDTVRDGFQRVGMNFSQTASGMGDTLRGVGASMVSAIAPADGALSTFGNKIRTTAGNMHADFAPARAAFASLGPAALEAGKVAGNNLTSGIKGAASGLMGVLGGPWGLALAAATIGLGIFAAEQAEAKAKVDALADSLNNQSGAFSASSKKLVAADFLDLDADAWDDFNRLGQRNMEELVRDTKANVEEITDILSDPTGRDAFVDNWKKIHASVMDGSKVTEELAASVGMTAEQLKGLNAGDIQEMVRQFEGAANTAREAEAKIALMAKATGTSTIQAAALAANYDILNSSTSSVTQKFGAFKSNLDILNGGLETARNATRDNAEEMLNFGDNVVALAEKNGGLIEGTKQLSQAFKDSLLNIDGTFSNASKGSIDFSRQMEASRDTILQVGIAEMQKLRDAGAELPVAQAGALKAMEGPMATFRQKLTDLGIDSTMVNQIMGQLGLDPEKLRGALVLDTKDAESKLARAHLMAAAFASGNYEVAFTALTDEAKTEILKVTEYAEAYKNGGWKAVMEIIDKTGDKVPEFLLGMKEAESLEDIKKVIDVENPGAKKIAEANDALSVYNMTPAQIKELKGVDQVSQVAATAGESVKGYNGYEVLTKMLTATDSTAPAVESAKGTMGALPDVMRSLLSTDKTADGKNAAQGTMNSLSDVTRSLLARNAAGVGVGLANLTMGLFTDKTADLKANDQASPVIRDVNNKGLADKTFNIIGVLSGVSQAVRDMLHMADGGIMMGGVQKFADGGILNGVKAYAGGGIENHTAQIAKGAWPVRVWAEPETGGEAYIPLGMNKRKRSLEILRQVMAEFGLSSFAQFANGGITPATNYSTPKVVSSRYSTSQSSVSQAVAAVGGSPASVVNFVVNPSQGLSEQQIGEAAMEHLYWKLSTNV